MACNSMPPTGSDSKEGAGVDVGTDVSVGWIVFVRLGVCASIVGVGVTSMAVPVGGTCGGVASGVDGCEQAADDKIITIVTNRS